AEAEALAAQGRINNDDSSLSAMEAGVVGAMVTLGVFVLVVLADWLSGIFTFGKHSQALSRTKSGSFSSGEEKGTSAV
ncbi:hypothetical protein ACHAQH_009166, partial [Verticillium albo-atrum]